MAFQIAHPPSPTLHGREDGDPDFSCWLRVPEGKLFLNNCGGGVSLPGGSLRTGGKASCFLTRGIPGVGVTGGFC